MKFVIGVSFILFVLHLVAAANGYNIIRKRHVDMRSFSLYDFPDDSYMAQQEAERQYYINPKPSYVTAFYPSYEFGRRR
ncbi:unnamed protein product [Caenorhabditis brenneri]